MSVRLLFTLFMGVSAPLAWSFSPQDTSAADTDGPYVFYEGDKILVKYILRRDTVVKAKTMSFTDKKSVSINCQVPKTGDSFSFLLQEEFQKEQTEYPAPAQLLALSDIEGDFAAFKSILLGANVINKDFSWAFGKGHLVLVGDFFDRGLQVTECLWLIYKLETEARKAGGKVHFILGNHEVLNLQGNTTYVRKKYLANAQLMGEPYLQLFDHQTELGRWLRTKNVVEKIGDYVFCHGGISPELACTRLTLSTINAISRAYLALPANAPLDEATQSIFNTKTGILWYRGLAKNQPSDEEMTKILAYANAKRMVVGHTLHPDLVPIYDGRLLCIDLFHAENMRQGSVKTLWIEGGKDYVISSNGEKRPLSFDADAPRIKDK